MSGPPNPEHGNLRTKLRESALAGGPVLVQAADLIVLLDLLHEQDEALYHAWEYSMGDDL